MTPLELTRSVRSLNRLRQIAKVLTKHGFGHVVHQTNLSRFVPSLFLRAARPGEQTDEGPTSLGQRLVAVATELGPTFVKLGQLLSTRPDIVPQDVLSELRTLQDSVPPFETAEAMRIIEEQLGRAGRDRITWIADAPIASASIGQVYLARLADGENVVIKVRRPGIEATIKLDMQLLTWMAKSLEDFVPEARVYRPSMLVAELEETLTRELDYINEASVTSRFGQALRDIPGIRTPEVRWDLCGQRVLTLEALSGVNVETVVRESDNPAVDRRLVAHRLADSFLRQVFEIGLFHADLHPGNILIEPPAKVGLIDFGQTGSISDELMTELIALVFAMMNGEIEVVIDTLADMGALGRSTDRRQLHRALEMLIGKYYGLPIKRFNLQSLFNEFADIMRKNDVVIPRDVATLLKGAGTVASVIAMLDPELDILELLRPRLRAAVNHRLTPSAVARRSALMTWDLISIVRKAPRQLRDILRRLSSAGWELTIRHENLEGLTRELDRSSNRVAFAVVIAGIIIGSSVVFSAAADFALLGIKVQYFGIAGYLVAGFMGLGLTWAIYRSGRLH